MKFLYKTMYSALLMGAMGLNATAQQQLPNWGFEEAWSPYTPWTSNNTNKSEGTTPTDWCVSNVIGMDGTGATTIAFNVAGYNSDSAVELKNVANAWKPQEIVPAYISLGKTWSTSTGLFSITNKDGGCFDGKPFSSRPTGIEFMYKRARGTSKPNEQSTVVAYLWKGSVSQADVPGNIAASASKLVKVTMPNRDRCVLKMGTEGFTGGAIDYTPDFKLIAKINEAITENTTEWTKFSTKFEYESNDTPESINVIIASGDYFGGASVVGADNSITIDNVRLFYNFEGKLDIDCEEMGGELAKGQATTITIIPDGNGKCTFMLPDFKLGEGDDAMILGDIVVDDVTMTDNNGITTYAGVTKGLKLMNDMIEADVTISGRTQGDKADMTIDVLWTNSPMNENGTPINVNFATTTPPDDIPTGITDITVDNIDNSNAPVEFFNLQGVRVAADNLTPGIYVRRQGSKVSKVLVK